MKLIPLILACSLTYSAANARAQGSIEVGKLQSEVELLKTKLQLAQKEIELLTSKLEKLSAENGQLKEGTDQAVAPKSAKLDQFAEGAIWRGEAKRADHPDRTAQWVLTVIERKGGLFKGEVVVRSPDGKVMTAAVDGRAPTSDHGLVEIRTEKNGFGQMRLRGTLTEGQVGLVFVGTSPFGEPGAGAATLRRVSE